MSGSLSRPRRRPPLFCPAATPAPDAGAAVPEPSAFVAAAGRAAAHLSSAILLSLSLAGCVETGDLGRPRRSLWNDQILPAAGAAAAQLRNEPVSRYVLTDDEDELRDRAWRFLMPAHERSRFERVIADLVRTRVLPPHLQPADRTAYHRALMSESFRSPMSRYRRLGDDVQADVKLIAPFATRASRVLAADRVRLRSLSYVRSVDEEQIHHALARVAENRCLIAWVREESLGRVVSYRYALEHLIIEAPHGEAVAAERLLAHLESHRRILDELVGPPPAGMACAGVETAVLAVETGAPALVETPARGPLVVRN